MQIEMFPRRDLHSLMVMMQSSFLRGWDASWGGATSVGVHDGFRSSCGERVDKRTGDAGAVLGTIELMEGNTQIVGAF